ncbi:hypothetical protein vseg_015204 [Gypsophila vaccaria]
MVNDALRDSVGTIRDEALNTEHEDETPNLQVLALFNMLKKAGKPLFEGCTMSVLAASRLLILNYEHNLSHRCVDGISSLIGDINPNNNNMTSNFYKTKKLLKGLQLSHKKIDVSPDMCMLFWNDDEHLNMYRKCGIERYKPNRNVAVRHAVKWALTYFPLAPL